MINHSPKDKDDKKWFLRNSSSIKKISFLSKL